MHSMHAFYSRAFNPDRDRHEPWNAPPSSASWTSPGRPLAVPSVVWFRAGLQASRLRLTRRNPALEHLRLSAASPQQQVGRLVVDNMYLAPVIWLWIGPRSQARLHPYQLAHLLVEGFQPRIPPSQTRIETGSPSGCSTIEADVDSGQPLNPSDLEAAVINTRIGALAGKRGVHRVLPAWPQPGHGIRCAMSLARDGVEPLGFFAEPAVGIDSACGQEQVRVKISVITIAGWRVQGAVHADTKLLRDFLGKAEGQRGALLGIQFVGKREHNFAREHGITPAVVQLQVIPEPFAIVHKPAARQVDARIEHALAAAVIKDLAGALIGDQCAGAIGRRSCRRSAAGASNGRASAQMKNCHCSSSGVSGRSPDRTYSCSAGIL